MFAIRGTIFEIFQNPIMSENQQKQKIRSQTLHFQSIQNDDLANLFECVTFVTNIYDFHEFNEIVTTNAKLIHQDEEIGHMPIKC